MSGDPSKASLWNEADVFIGSLTAAIPANASVDFSDDWELAGLLDGDDGFQEDRSEDTDNKYAWGGVLVRTARKNFTLTRKWTPIEDNDTIRGLLWPGSDWAVGLKVPRPARTKIAFELREGAKVKRLISSFQVETVPDGTITENEADLTKYPMVTTIFPTADGFLWKPQEGIAS